MKIKPGACFSASSFSNSSHWSFLKQKDRAKTVVRAELAETGRKWHRCGEWERMGHSYYLTHPVLVLGISSLPDPYLIIASILAPRLREHKSWQFNPNALSTNSRHSLHYRGSLLSFYAKHYGSPPKSLSWLFQLGPCHFSHVTSPLTPPASLSHIGIYCTSQEREIEAWTGKVHGEVRNTFMGYSPPSHILEGS